METNLKRVLTEEEKAMPLLKWNIVYMRKHGDKWYKLIADQTGRDLKNALDRFRSNIKGTFQILECKLK